MHTYLRFAFLLVFMVLLANVNSAASNEKLNSEQDLTIETLSATNHLSEYSQLQLQDNFFRRLFGSRKTKAERVSRSQRHASRPQRYTPPPSQSQDPQSYSSRSSGASASSSNQAVRNQPKPPLHTSLRDQYYALGVWEIGLSVGTAHPITDIAENKGLGFNEFADYHTNNFNFKLGFFTRYIMNEWFALSLGMDYANLSGQVPFGENLPENVPFRFTNDIFEFYAKTELMLPALSRSPFDLYGFVGIGLFFSDARVFDNRDRIVESEVDYSQVQPVIPMGLGFSYTLPNGLRLGYEFGWRNTIFHYLDGVKRTRDNYDNYFFNSLKISYSF
jgi:hypothetical protein